MQRCNPIVNDNVKNHQQELLLMKCWYLSVIPLNAPQFKEPLRSEYVRVLYGSSLPRNTQGFHGATLRDAVERAPKEHQGMDGNQPHQVIADTRE